MSRNTQGDVAYIVSTDYTKEEGQRDPIFRIEAYRHLTKDPISQTKAYFTVISLEDLFTNINNKDKTKKMTYKTSDSLRTKKTNKTTEEIAQKHQNQSISIFAGKSYEPMALRTKPIISDLPSRFRIIRKIVGDPLKDLPTLPTNPEPFVPTLRYSLERKEIIDKLHSDDLLWPKERDLLHQFMTIQEDDFAWDDSERGHFREDFFLPAEMPIVPLYALGSS